jgi:hypothetical protein
MNKRSFLKSILLAAVAPGLLLARSQNSYKWKRQNGLWVTEYQCEWQPVGYETYFIDVPPVYDSRILINCV